MTIKDVAKKAGVSISTASYALNDRPNVHPQTRERVLKAAEELNYFPNAHARNLKSQKSRNIGVFINGFGGPIYSDLLEGINLELQKKNYNIIVSSGKSSSVMLRQRSVDAAIVFDEKIPNEDIIRFSRRQPIVVLDRVLQGENIYSSMIENERLVYEFILSLVKEKGYKNITYVSGPKNSVYGMDRYKGFLKALEELNIKNHNFIQCDFTINSGYEAGFNMIENNQIPDLVYSANDEMAIGVIKAFNEKNIEIPNRVAVAGFDGIYITDYTTPKLTTIAINYFEWGRQLAGFLTRLLNNISVYPLVNPEAKVVFKESV